MYYFPTTTRIEWTEIAPCRGDDHIIIVTYVKTGPRCSGQTQWPTFVAFPPGFRTIYVILSLVIIQLCRIASKSVISYGIKRVVTHTHMCSWHDFSFGNLALSPFATTTTAADTCPKSMSFCLRWRNRLSKTFNYCQLHGPRSRTTTRHRTVTVRSLLPFVSTAR